MLYNQINRSEKKSLWIHIISAIFVVILGNFSVAGSLLLSSLYAVYLITRTNPLLLAPLFILFIDSSTILNPERINDPNSGGLIILGFPLKPTLVCLIAISFVNFWSYLNFQRFRNIPFVKFGFPLWCMITPIIFINTYLGFIEGNHNWSMALRNQLSIGCVFYGVFLAFRNDHLLLPTLKSTGYTIIIILIFSSFNIVWSHLAFIGIGLATSIAIYYLFQRKILVFLLLFSIVLFSVIFKVDTYTAWVIFVGSTGASIVILIFYYSQPTKKFILAFFFVLSLAITPATLQLGQVYFSDYSQSWFNDDVKEQIVFKFVGDRLSLWMPAYIQIRNSKPVITPTGKPLLYREGGLRSGYWFTGSHNSYLEVLRQCGLTAGLILLFISVWSLYRFLLSLTRTSNPFLLCFGSSIFFTTLILMVVIHSPVDQVVGPVVWILSGLFIYFSYPISFSPANGDPHFSRKKHLIYHTPVR